jgi:hypothetical protein
MTQLSEHFHLSEFVSSQTAARRGIDNTPPAGAIVKLQALCRQVLEPVRVHFGRPIRISSGYRCPTLNKAIGGAASSQHVLGEAADFEIPGLSNVDVAQWMMKHLSYDQLILEFHTPGEPNSGWVHVSWRPNPRNEELTAVRRGGRTKYLTGLVA